MLEKDHAESKIPVLYCVQQFNTAIRILGKNTQKLYSVNPILMGLDCVRHRTIHRKIRFAQIGHTVPLIGIPKYNVESIDNIWTTR